jgi:hypothetical protein
MYFPSYPAETLNSLKVYWGCLGMGLGPSSKTTRAHGNTDLSNSRGSLDRARRRRM